LKGGGGGEASKKKNGGGRPPQQKSGGRGGGRTPGNYRVTWIRLVVLGLPPERGAKHTRKKLKLWLMLKGGGKKKRKRKWGGTKNTVASEHEKARGTM